MLHPATPELSAMLPSTTYFEVDSAIVGARFGIWVTTPPRYDLELDAVYPVIFQPDGNAAVAMTAPATALLRDHPVAPIQPFIQVGVGYRGVDAARWLAVRARDLLPPGEPLLPGVDEESVNSLVPAGVLDQEGADLYLHHLRNPAGEKFLAFLLDELYPLISAEFRVDDSVTGLHGYSYGGLFATYAALQRTRINRIGVGSAGILAGASTVFASYEAELTSGADHHDRMLHMTIGAPEITDRSVYQAAVTAGSVEFMRLAQQTPLRGLAFSAKIIADESHATGWAASWFSFLRTCFPGQQSGLFGDGADADPTPPLAKGSDHA
ncbi:alpha/beta hydrolase [Tsukamurella asaccharolytica]|uniref:Alpha/beta hydrolase n=1 Tax=Tsukamurella asaccharolytica TaxID=2592067 RepID=A0A5C5R8U3_9ACTN|nr:alpha/beta hydrolase-fold protein [Tsukamurella asaccharolytica]TWS19380.1 alpha/beta hydrolase [Tsukamurella asaccharolytica]